MPITGLSLDTETVVESTLDPDKGTDKATKFTICALDSRVYGRLKDKATTLALDPNRADSDTVMTSINSNEVAFETVMYGLRGWENFVGSDGKEIKFKFSKRTHGGQSYKIADPDLVKLIPQAVLIEIAGHIQAANELSEAEEKN